MEVQHCCSIQRVCSFRIWFFLINFVERHWNSENVSSRFNGEQWFFCSTVGHWSSPFFFSLQNVFYIWGIPRTYSTLHQMCFEFNWMEAQVARYDRRSRFLRNEFGLFVTFYVLVCYCITKYFVAVLSVNVGWAWPINGDDCHICTVNNGFFWFRLLLFAIIFHKHVERQPIVFFCFIYSPWRFFKLAQNLLKIIRNEIASILYSNFSSLISNKNYGSLLKINKRWAIKFRKQLI